MGNNQTKPGASVVTQDACYQPATVDGTLEYAYLISRHTEHKDAIYQLSGILGSPVVIDDVALRAVITQMYIYSIEYRYLPHVVRALKRRNFDITYKTIADLNMPLITDPMAYFKYVIDEVAKNAIIHERFWTNKHAFSNLFDGTIFDCTNSIYERIQSIIVNTILTQTIQARTFCGCVHINSGPTTIQTILHEKNLIRQYMELDVSKSDLRMSWLVVLSNMVYSMFYTPGMKHQLQTCIGHAIVSTDCQIAVFCALLQCARDDIVNPCELRVDYLLELFSCTDSYFGAYYNLWSVTSAPGETLTKIVALLTDIVDSLTRRHNEPMCQNVSREVALTNKILQLCNKFPIQQQMEPLTIEYFAVATCYSRYIVRTDGGKFADLECHEPSYHLPLEQVDDPSSRRNEFDAIATRIDRMGPTSSDEEDSSSSDEESTSSKEDVAMGGTSSPEE